VASVSLDRGAEATVWALGNGVRVVVKTATFKRGSVVMAGWQPGGTSVISDADFVHARFATEILGHSGAGKCFIGIFLVGVGADDLRGLAGGPAVGIGGIWIPATQRPR